MEQQCFIKERTRIVGLSDDLRNNGDLNAILTFDPVTGCLGFQPHVLAREDCNPRFERGILQADIRRAIRLREEVMDRQATETHFRRRSVPLGWSKRRTAVMRPPRKTPMAPPKPAVQTVECTRCEREVETQFCQDAKSREEYECKKCEYYQSLHDSNTPHSHFQKTCIVCLEEEGNTITPDQPLEEKEDVEVEEVVEVVEVVPAKPAKKGGWLW